MNTEKFKKDVAHIANKGVEDIPYEETLTILEKHSMEQFLTEEAKAKEKKLKDN